MIKYLEEDELSQKDVIPLSATQLQEEITQREDNEHKDKRTKNWKEWKKDINALMKEYNLNFGKVYKLIK